MTSAAHEPTVTTWTVDAPVLGRAVDVFMDSDRSPTLRDLFWSLNSEEDQRLVQAAHEAEMTELRQNPVPATERVEHDCDRSWCGCCPGCLDGCGDCEPYIICWDRDLDCVMHAGHAGNCVPGGSPWKTHAAVAELAEPLRIAGIAHTLIRHERNPERWRLERKADHQVPDSGRWVRRWTPHNTNNTTAWLAEAGYTSFKVHGDTKGPLLLIAREPTRRRGLDVPLGHILRLEGGRITDYDGGWINCGRPLPAGAAQPHLDWSVR